MNNLRNRLALVLICLLSLLSTTPANGITGGAVPSPEDSRFDAIGAFATIWRLGFPFEPPPPESGDNNWYCSATLVTSSLIVTARHCALTYGEIGLTYPHAVRFRRRLDGSIGTVEEGPDSFFHAFIDHFVLLPYPENGDVAFGVLTEPVTHIEPIPILPPLTAATAPRQTPSFIAGWGREGANLLEGPFSRLKVCESFVAPASPPYFLYPSPWGNPPHECGPNSFDSGGAVIQEEPFGLLGVVNMSTVGTFAGQNGGKRR